MPKPAKPRKPADLVDIMKPGKEYTTAQIGDMLLGGAPTEQHWQKYALPAGKLLKRAKKQGIVISRYDFGRGYSRTFWKLNIHFLAAKIMLDCLSALH